MTSAGRDPIGVLLVEDSPTVRAFLRGAIEAAPDLQVVGEAADGEAGVASAASLRPDVIVMDIAMPRLDGVAATRRIMRARPTPILVFCARSDAEGIRRGFAALAEGALSLLDKPHPADGRRPADVARDLLSRVRLLAGVQVSGRGSRRTAPSASPRQTHAPRRPREVLAIAASTGGPAALGTVLGGLPRPCSASVLLVQHIIPGFTEGFGSWLATRTGWPVRVAAQHELLRPGQVYLAPEGRHLALRAPNLLTCPTEPAGTGPRPSADVLFRSVARTCASRALGVVLTGMGRDGAEGLLELHRAGGLVLAQDGASCVVDGMPRAAREAGAVDRVVPLERLAATIATLLGAG